jgi:hypothetical protein
MQKLIKEYGVLNSKIDDCWSVIDMIQAMKENLTAKGRGHTKVTNDEARNSLYCLEENLTIDLYQVKKQIVQRILKMVEEGMSFYTNSYLINIQQVPLITYTQLHIFFVSTMILITYYQAIKIPMLRPIFYLFIMTSPRLLMFTTKIVSILLKFVKILMLVLT